MTIQALDIGVLSFQGKGALFVGLLVEERFLPVFLVVTGLTIGAGGAFLELPLVGVVAIVAIRAAFECYLTVVVAVLVAFRAGPRVPSRKFGGIP